MYFGNISESVILLLCGGDKSTQEADIRRAKEYWSEYKLRAAVEKAEEGSELALRDVAEARGIGQVAAAANLNRESLYRMLSEGGNPRLSSLDALLHALGLRLAVEVLE